MGVRAHTHVFYSLVTHEKYPGLQSEQAGGKTHPSMLLRVFLVPVARFLTLRSHLPVDEGLLLVESKDSRMDASIHMLMVFMDLGVVWINNDSQVVDSIAGEAWYSAVFPQAAGASMRRKLTPRGCEGFPGGRPAALRGRWKSELR